MHCQADSPRDKTYLFNYFDISSKEPPSFDQRFHFSRLRSALVYAINKVVRMSKYIIICFDVASLKDVDLPSEATALLFRNWLLIEMK